MEQIEHTRISACPLCASQGREFVGSYKTYLRPFDLVEESFYAYCMSCDFAYCVNPLTEESSARYYRNNFQYRRKEIAGAEAWHVSDQVRLAVSKLWSRNDASILEVGPDNGSFLAMAHTAINANCYYDELNPDSVAILQTYGFKSLNEAGAPSHYDLIVIRHVLEHIPFPIAYVRDYLKPKLKPNGVLFVEVPDYTYVDSVWSDVFQFEHVNYFSLTSLHKLSKDSALEVEEVSFAQTPGYATSPSRVMRVCLRNTVRNTHNSYGNWQHFFNGQDHSLSGFRAVLASTKKLALYGAGTHTANLLANCANHDAIVAIYDADPNKIGTQILGHKIFSPENLVHGDFDKLVVTVIGYENEVLQFLGKKSVPTDKIISLSKLIQEGLPK